MIYFMTKVNLSKLSFISIKLFCWKTVIKFSETISFYARAKSEQKSICSPFAAQSYITWQVNLCSSAFHRPKTWSFSHSFFYQLLNFPSYLYASPDSSTRFLPSYRSCLMSLSALQFFLWCSPELIRKESQPSSKQ